MTSILLALTVACAAPAPPVPSTAADDSARVAAAVTQFHAALAAGDSSAALAVLAPGAVILESGGIETVAQYRAGHLAGDIEFSRATTRTDALLTVRVSGDAAWAWSVSRMQGTFRGRAVDSDSAELMVLVRTAAGWRIAAIHWSSRRRAS
jgi:ketosteroid isomerase-like protein